MQLVQLCPNYTCVPRGYFISIHPAWQHNVPPKLFDGLCSATQLQLVILEPMQQQWLWSFISREESTFPKRNLTQTSKCTCSMNCLLKSPLIAFLAPAQCSLAHQRNTNMQFCCLYFLVGHQLLGKRKPALHEEILDMMVLCCLDLESLLSSLPGWMQKKVHCQSQSGKIAGGNV